jgi:hypothetical protein
MMIEDIQQPDTQTSCAGQGKGSIPPPHDIEPAGHIGGGADPPAPPPPPPPLLVPAQKRMHASPESPPTLR